MTFPRVVPWSGQLRDRQEKRYDIVGIIVHDTRLRFYLIDYNPHGTINDAPSSFSTRRGQARLPF